MSKLIIPENYEPIIDPGHSQIAIKQIKDFFQDELAHFLVLRRRADSTTISTALSVQSISH